MVKFYVPTWSLFAGPVTNIIHVIILCQSHMHLHRYNYAYSTAQRQCSSCSSCIKHVAIELTEQLVVGYTNSSTYVL